MGVLLLVVLMVGVVATDSIVVAGTVDVDVVGVAGVADVPLVIGSRRAVLARSGGHIYRKKYKLSIENLICITFIGRSVKGLYLIPALAELGQIPPADRLRVTKIRLEKGDQILWFSASSRIR